MKFIGWIGLIHVIFIMGWMVFNIIFSYGNPMSDIEGQSMAEAGIEYYSNHQGLMGMDHGSKALIMLLSILLPIGLYVYFNNMGN